MDMAIGFFLGVSMLAWPWIMALILLFLIEIALCERNYFTGATLLLLFGTSFLFWVAADFNMGTWMWTHKVDAVVFLGKYLLIGGVWSLLKWFSVSLKMKEQLRVDREIYDGRAPDEIENFREEQRPSRPPKSYARNSKARIIGWIGHWPFSMLGYFIGEFLTRVFEWVFNMFRGAYEWIEKRVWGDEPEESE